MIVLPGLLIQSRLDAAKKRTTTEGPDVTPEEINAAIEKGQKFLISVQTPAGSWETAPKRIGKAHDWEHMQGDSYGGFTAVACYGLLASGYSAQAPEMAKALDFLHKADVIGIYSLGLRANVWPLVPQTPENKAWLRAAIENDKTLILNGVNTGEGINQWMWDYGNGKDTVKHRRLDHSVSQYGVLGLWACSKEGADVPADVWGELDTHWRKDQFPDGGWAYDASPAVPGKQKETPSMTAAGVATLFITQDYILAEKGAGCGDNVANENIDRGLAWMSQHFREVNNNYAWYGIERIGAASGLKYFGGIDWFREGANNIVRSQLPNGSWKGGFAGATPIPATAFALVFLARGGAPVLVNKLEYSVAGAPAKPAEKPTTTATRGQTTAEKATEDAIGKEGNGHWNQRPRDVANIVKWIGEETESDLNWQIVNLHISAVDLSDAPVLYISGDQWLQFSEQEKQKLKEFVYRGGMIFGAANCASPAFAQSFEQLGTDMFGLEFRQLPQSHPILTLEEFRANKWRVQPVVRGLTNGVREFMLLMPQDDPGRYWQTRAASTHNELFELGADAFEYTVDKNPEVKGITHIVLPDAKIVTTQSLKVARLEAGPNWDPEPGGWQRLSAIFHNQLKIDLTTQPVKIDVRALSHFKVAHLTGTTKFVLTDDERATLLDWVRHGGTLIIDAAGGSSDFADAAEAELKTIFGAAAEKGLDEPLPTDFPMFGIPGLVIDEITYRPYARRFLVGDTKIPRIRGIMQDRRVAVFYSREDLSAGLVGENVDGIYGYAPAVATSLMRNLLMFAGKLRPPERERAVKK